MKTVMRWYFASNIRLVQCYLYRCRIPLVLPKLTIRVGPLITSKSWLITDKDQRLDFDTCKGANCNMQQIDCTYQLVESRHVLRRIRNCMLLSRDWLPWHDGLRNCYDVNALRNREFSKLSFWRFYYCSILWHYIIIEVSKNYESNRWLINHDELSMTLLRKNESFMGQVILNFWK